MKDTNKTKKQLIADISELRRRVAEMESLQDACAGPADALRESEARYRFISENVGDFIWQLVYGAVPPARGWNELVAEAKSDGFVSASGYRETKVRLPNSIWPTVGKSLEVFLGLEVRGLGIDV